MISFHAIVYIIVSLLSWTDLFWTLNNIKIYYCEGKQTIVSKYVCHLSSWAQFPLNLVSSSNCWPNQQKSHVKIVLSAASDCWLQYKKAFSWNLTTCVSFRLRGPCWTHITSLFSSWFWDDAVPLNWYRIFPDDFSTDWWLITPFRSVFLRKKVNCCLSYLLFDCYIFIWAEDDEIFL